MAAESTLPPVPSENKAVDAARGVVGFYHAVIAEMKKVTWPEVVDVRRATVAIIVFVLLLGLGIYLMDILLQGLLGKLIPSLFVGNR